MSIQTNWMSLISWRAFSRNGADLDGSLRKLSSGLRINTAADDAAGLAIAHNLLSQYKGLVQATRNALDGVNLLNTGEGALQEIHSMLQRGRELALQAANGVYTDQERQSIQTELDNILAEIDRVALNTEFNGIKLFNASGMSSNATAVVNGLRSGWLDKAADVIKTFYGMEGDTSTLKIVLESGGSTAAWISGTNGLNGVLDSLTIHVNVSQFGTGTIADDRKIARALTQATLARNVDYVSLPPWFQSGVADYLAGADEQLATDVATYGAAAVVNAMGTTWVDDSLHRSSAYLFMKYIANRMAPGDMAWLIDEMKLSNGANNLNTALTTVVGSTYATLRAQFLAPGAAGGVSFLSTLNLTDTDVGSINTPADNITVIPDGGTYTETPLDPAFKVQLDASNLFDPVIIDLQVGANFGDLIRLEIPHVSTLGLNLTGIDVVKRATAAVDKFDAAVGKLSSIRAQLGSYTVRLESTVNANNAAAEYQLGSYSRITDVDFAKQLADYTRQQILVSSSGAMLAQANTIRQNVKWLLNGLSAAKNAATSRVMFSTS